MHSFNKEAKILPFHETKTFKTFHSAFDFFRIFMSGGCFFEKWRKTFQF